jgi:hypothetical protein
MKAVLAFHDKQVLPDGAIVEMTIREVASPVVGSAQLNALSPKRLELLRAVHETPAPSVKALAERLGRDYKRVHEDVETLTASGLLRRENGSVSAPYDAITAEMRL